MSFTDIFIRRPVLAIVVNLVIIIAGLWSVRGLNVRQYPKLESATVTIRTAYVGADADLAIFDPATVIDRSTYEDATIPAAGIPFVIVGGQVVVDSGKVTAARPGKAIRAPIR